VKTKANNVIKFPRAPKGRRSVPPPTAEQLERFFSRALGHPACALLDLTNRASARSAEETSPFDYVALQIVMAFVQYRDEQQQDEWYWRDRNRVAVINIRRHWPALTDDERRFLSALLGRERAKKAQAA
jgi:hypothetical protein